VDERNFDLGDHAGDKGRDKARQLPDMGEHVTWDSTQLISSWRTRVKERWEQNGLEVGSLWKSPRPLPSSLKVQCIVVPKIDSVGINFNSRQTDLGGVDMGIEITIVAKKKRRLKLTRFPLPPPVVAAGDEPVNMAGGGFVALRIESR
jgi:hypothetical protein